MKIFKYELNPVGETKVSLPAAHALVHLALQKGKPHAWFAVDPDITKVELKVIVVPTGGDVPRGAEHMGTLLYNGGEFVAHFFAVPS